MRLKSVLSSVVSLPLSGDPVSVETAKKKKKKKKNPKKPGQVAKLTAAGSKKKKKKTDQSDRNGWTCRTFIYCCCTIPHSKKVILIRY